MTINLKMKTSDAFKDGEVDPEIAGNMEEEELEKDQEECKFPWHAEEGFLGNIRKLKIQHFQRPQPCENLCHWTPS